MHANTRLIFRRTETTAPSRWEAVRRLANPARVAGVTVLVVAVIGVSVNGVSALLFMAGSKDDLNIRGPTSTWRRTRRP